MNTSTRNVPLFHFLVLFVLILSQSLFSLGTKASEKGLLFRISGNDLQKPSYLLGTMHIICADKFVMDQLVLDAIEQSDVIMMELDLNDPQLSQQMQSVMMHPEMKNIATFLNEEETEAMNKILHKSFGVGLEQLGFLKPFVLSSMLTMMQIRCDSVQSYERYILKKAAEYTLPIIGLETVSFQMAIFDSVPYEFQVNELLKQVLEEDKTYREFTEMQALYVAGDLDGLYSLLMENDQMQLYQDKLVVQRNLNWIPIIEKKIVDKKAFIAVGAGHLPGDQGVIQLLRNAGYIVDAIW